MFDVLGATRYALTRKRCSCLCSRGTFDYSKERAQPYDGMFPAHKQFKLPSDLHTRASHSSAHDFMLRDFPLTLQLNRSRGTEMS